MNHEAAIHLVIVEENANKAESHADTLRDAGYPVRLEYAGDLEALEGILKSGCPDMVLCAAGPRLPAAESVSALLLEHGTGIPLIVLDGQSSDDNAVVVVDSGTAQPDARNSFDCLQSAFMKVHPLALLQNRLRQLESRLEESENRCSMLMAASRDAFAWLHEGRHISASAGYLRLFDLDHEDAITGTPFLDRIAPQDHEHVRCLLDECSRDRAGSRTLEISCIQPSHGAFAAVMEAAPVRLGGKACTQIVIRDRDSAELDRRLDTLSRQDMLTGLGNRQHFMRAVENSIHDGIDSGKVHTIIYLLLDNMKSVREETGATGFDRVVREIAGLIADSCPEQDTIARFGDYVFTILHRDSSEEGIRELAQTLRTRIGDHVTDIGDYSAVTTCSIGICIINAHTTDPDDALSRADLACEVARSAGGNQIHIHSTAVDEKMASAHEAEWDEIINRTINEERFYLVYQPIISMKGDPVQRYEVLLRILDEQGQIILPGQFVSIADRIGLSGAIDRRVIEHAFRTLLGAQDEEPDTEFFIKLSAATLKDRELPAWISRKLKEYRLKSDRIIFEIPETLAVRDLKNTMLFVKAMQKLRCRVALEHFGSINQPQLVRHLSADLLKIDGSLVNNLAASKDQQEAVKGVVDLAHKSGIQCIAERVDNAADLSRLWECGVDYIQGNFVQEPSRELNFDFSGEIA